jgi:hypothetical protein
MPHRRGGPHYAQFQEFGTQARPPAARFPVAGVTVARVRKDGRQEPLEKWGSFIL